MRRNQEMRLQIINYLNSFFDKIYLISLPDSTDRHELLNERLNGLNYEIFWGVDGEQLDLKELEEERIYLPELTREKNLSGKELQPNEIGCSLSHLNIYRDMIDNNYRTALILEDDVFLEDSDPDKLSDALEDLPSDWEFLYLGYIEDLEKIPFTVYLRLYLIYPLLYFFGFRRYDRKRLRRKYFRPFTENIDIAGFHAGTHAYGITAEAAKKVLEFQNPVTMAPDNAIGVMCMDGKLKSYRLKERLFFQDRSLPTTIPGRYEHEYANSYQS
jgi:glycosyl transferase, family 25